MGENIRFFAWGNKAYLKWIKEGEVGQFVDAVRSPMGKPIPQTSPRPENTASDRTRELKQLLEALLSQDEFESKRHELLKDL